MEDQQLSHRDLHHTSPTSPMGRFLRRFWHPVFVAEDLPAGKAMPIRILSEDLTLFRGLDGLPRLVGARCAHRRTVMHTGVVEEEGIRCMYHGWRYDGSGLCTDIPSEKSPRKEAIRIAGYPAHEYGGLIFAYLGPVPAPVFQLPRKAELEDPNRTLFAKRETWPCNWFQHIENSMDALHLSFAHMWGVRGQFGSYVSGGGQIPELDYVETSAGIHQTATRPNGNVRTSDWTFPNNNHVVAPGPDKDAPWPHTFAWAVPIDDTHTARFTTYSVAERDEKKIGDLRLGFDLPYDPSLHAEKLFEGDVASISEPALISAQDFVAVVGQGEIVDRSEENLSNSDKGIIFLRRLFLRELRAQQAGQEMKTWERLPEHVSLASPPGRSSQ